MFESAENEYIDDNVAPIAPAEDERPEAEQDLEQERADLAGNDKDDD